MAGPLKNIYNKSFLEELCEAAKSVDKAFNKAAFLSHFFTPAWDDMELKDRMKHISECLQKHLGGTYTQQVNSLLKMINWFKQHPDKVNGFEYMFFPDFLEQFGQDDPKLSLNAMEEVTQFTSCEFAIRPFLIQNQKEVMKRMLKWSTHQHENVRRFSSEGCRPRLPWAMALPELKKDPSPILPILENLKDDSSEFVRKSVANNLNDISKDHPEVVVQMAQKWLGTSKNTDWIVKHGCRTLLRKAHPEVLKLFNMSTETNCKVTHLKTEAPSIKLGDDLFFSFQLENQGKKAATYRVEFGIYYMKANGSQSRKLFKITENEYAPNKPVEFTRKHGFKDLTTRKHYAGLHKLVIVINGNEEAEIEFDVS